MNLPNLLTLSRLPLAALPWVDLGSTALLLATLAAAGLTDVLDGLAARWLRARRLRRHQPPGRVATPDAVGAWLDPVCDKTFIASMLAVVFVAMRPEAYLVLLVATREILQVPLVALAWAVPAFRRRVHFDFTAGVPGKAATVVQLVTLAVIRLGLPGAVPLAWSAAALGAYAAAFYLARAIRPRPAAHRG